LPLGYQDSLGAVLVLEKLWGPTVKDYCSHHSATTAATSTATTFATESNLSKANAIQ
jgi:hypothetical protein